MWSEIERRTQCVVKAKQNQTPNRLQLKNSILFQVLRPSQHVSFLDPFHHRAVKKSASFITERAHFNSLQPMTHIMQETL